MEDTVDVKPYGVPAPSVVVPTTSTAASILVGTDCPADNVLYMVDKIVLLMMVA